MRDEQKQTPQDVCGEANDSRNSCLFTRILPSLTNSHFAYSAGRPVCGEWREIASENNNNNNSTAKGAEEKERSFPRPLAVLP